MCPGIGFPLALVGWALFGTWFPRICFPLQYLFSFCVLGSHGFLVSSRRRVPRKRTPIRPDVARPWPEQSFVGSDLLQESFIIFVLFSWYLRLGDVVFYVVAIVEAKHPGMKAGAHLLSLSQSTLWQTCLPPNSLLYSSPSRILYSSFGVGLCTTFLLLLSSEMLFPIFFLL